MFGHFAEDIVGISSPDNYQSAAFNMYALEYEIEDAINDARKTLNEYNGTFDSVQEMQKYIEAQNPNSNFILTNTDYQKLFFEYFG